MTKVFEEKSSMKTTMKKFASIILVGATVLSLAACSKKTKKLTADEFKSKMEAEGYVVTDAEADEESGATVISAGSEDDTVGFSLAQFADKDSAKEYFEQIKTFADLAKQLDSNADVSKSSSKITVQNSEKYTVMILADDTIVTAMAEPASDEKVDKVKSGLKALGY